MDQGGAYALLVHLSQPAHLQVGRLGRFLFPQGYYLYLGSALRGLKARLARHLRQEKKVRWHIDYLLAQAEVVEVWWEGGRERQECAWAALAQVATGASLPVPGFGSSDCRCPSHLVYFPARPSSATILAHASISKLDLVPAGTELTGPPPAAARRRTASRQRSSPGPAATLP